MPYTVEERGGEYCVYKVGADGEATGEALDCHATPEEAGAQIGAIEESEMASNMKFACNQISGFTREETLEGREYLVSPVVMLRPGVLNEELVTQEEIAKWVDAWNGRPWTVGHPEQDGRPVSANAPDLSERQRIGWIYNAMIHDGALKAEVWTDIEKAQRVDGGAEVLARLRSEKPLEVSTGYYRVLEQKSGEHNGAAYSGIAHDLVPDHLAALPNQVGACSWRDGCGAPRINEEMYQREGATNEMSDSDLTDAEGLEEELETNAVVNVLRKLARFGYRLIRPNQEARMSKIQDILDCECAPFTEDELQSLSDESVDALAALVANAASDEVDEVVDPEPVDEEPEGDTLDLASALDAALADIGGIAGLKEALGRLQANENKRKEELVEELAANERLGMTGEELAAMSEAALEKMARAFKPRNYEGRGGGPQVNDNGIRVLSKPRVLSAEEGE